MDSVKKIYVILINLSLLSSTFSCADEKANTTIPQATQVPFKSNKRHLHEKKEVKKEVSEKKPHSRAARIHKKPQEKHETSHKKIIMPKNNEKKENSSEKDASSISHHSPKQIETKHQTKIARLHKKEPEVKKENIVQKTWGKIKAFFSSIKTD